MSNPMSVTQSEAPPSALSLSVAASAERSAEAATPARPARRGFAAMDRERQRQIASLGGRTAHQRGQAHEFTPEEARQAGRKGGESISRDRDYMADIGRRGGAARTLKQRKPAANSPPASA